MTQRKRPEQPCKPRTGEGDRGSNRSALTSAQPLSAPPAPAASDLGQRAPALTTRGQLGDGKGSVAAQGRPDSTSGGAIVDPAPTSAPWPPFTHFPESRGDLLAGEPVPSAPAPEALSAMTMARLQRRLKVVGMIMRMHRLGPRFVEEARAEMDALILEMRGRLRCLLAEALTPKRDSVRGRKPRSRAVR